MNWVFFAIGSAFFAGLTAILGKLGVEGINSNLATFYPYNCGFTGHGRHH